MQGETLLPIDIHTNKLLDWLISRRHCNKDWQAKALTVREKINAAIQDMPEVDEVTNLLSGTYINYFHCKRIVEILKDTEASSKNIFGRYSSQRMKDWQEIVRLYEKDNMYLAEAAQMLIRTVNYEVPALKRQIAKCQQVQQESIKKESDYTKHAEELKARYRQECKQLGIPGECVKKELLALLDELPTVFSDVVTQLKGCDKAIQFYKLFLEFTVGSEKAGPVLPLATFLIEHGNATTYQWKRGEAPEVVEETLPVVPVDLDNGSGNEDQIDFGDLNLDPGAAVGNGSPNGDFVHVDFNEGLEPVVVQEDEIKWDISIEDAGITVDSSSDDKGATVDGAKVARGSDALSILHNPETRTTFLNELGELQCFLTQRLNELRIQGDALAASIAQAAPDQVQLQTADRVEAMLAHLEVVLAALTSKRMQHLYQLHSSPKYVDRLVGSLQQLLYQADKMEQSRRAVLVGAEEALAEQRQLEPKRDLILLKTRELQKQIQEEISKRYKDRPVNIMGGITVM
ncbi:CDK5 regulatory subunit-associated protein 3-like isoform X2 [Ornithodoros turicata]|uniref:CDK5 regulatory subunit-associated protein 3-like isoform X2 n=1 Tax=Ornithodoros turicata TaxID=34597 RepID=UPI00313A03C3